MITESEKLARDAAAEQIDKVRNASAKLHANRYYSEDSERWWKCYADFIYGYNEALANRDASQAKASAEKRTPTPGPGRRIKNTGEKNEKS